MDEITKIVMNFYDSNPEVEWKRLEGYTYEFLLTIWMMKKHIKPGDKILDIGGGPGRYSLYFAKMGCDVTLVDLSTENVKMALRKSEEMNLPLKAFQADARNLDSLNLDIYDHIFIMGPMYHLFEESDRKLVIIQALKHLDDNGKIYVSFIQLFAGMNYYLSECPNMMPKDTELHPYFEKVIANETWCGTAFTKAVFINIDDIVPFMESLSLEKISLFGQEGITSANDIAVRSCDDEAKEAWLELSKGLCEQYKYLAFSSHIMYIGRKKR